MRFLVSLFLLRMSETLRGGGGSISAGARYARRETRELPPAEDNERRFRVEKMVREWERDTSSHEFFSFYFFKFCLLELILAFCALLSVAA